MRNMGFRLAAGSVKTARRRGVFTGSAASRTIVPGGNGGFGSQIRGHFYRGEKGTFSSRRDREIYLLTVRWWIVYANLSPVSRSAQAPCSGRGWIGFLPEFAVASSSRPLRGLPIVIE